MKKVIIKSLLLAWVGIFPAYANSYLEMITTKPDSHIDETSVTNNINENNPPPQAKPDLWYDSRIKTPAPVVTSPYPKYQAWLQSQKNENIYNDTKEEIQNMIYMLETGVLGWGLYEIYRYK